MADQRVNIKVSAQGAKKAQKDIGGLDGSIKKLGRSVLNASVAYFGTSGLINGIMKSAELAGIQEQAEKQLEFALGRTSQALLDQASALQMTTRFGDEATIAQMGFLASIGFTEEKIKEIIPVAMDLAEATGMSLESAVRNTAKTFSGMAGELGELVPQIRDLTAEQMKAGDAVRVMGELFEGQASAQANTYAGSVDQLKNELGDMAEDIGTIVIPVFETLAPHLKTAIKFWQEYLNVGEKTSEQTSQYDVEIQSLTDSIKFQTEAIQGLGATGMELNGSTERHNQLRRRAFDQGRGLVEQMHHELDMISKLIKERDELIELKNEELKKGNETVKVNNDIAKSLDVIKDANKSNTEQSKLAKMAEDERFVTSLSGARNLIKSLLAEATARLIAREMGKGLIGLITGSAGAIAVASLFDQAVPKFAQGGIVQGDPSRGDVVPVMATAGELILNQAQQENLVANSGITINISAPLVDETVVDSIIPAIERAKSLGTA
jgi:hypothetical protein|tara:strand:+ start:292 stop:1776 length:1485 start_codon:yes stop_codon:yes gene_type:complete